MQIRASAFEGESVSVTDLLADSLALTGSATLAAAQLHRRFHHWRGRLGRHFLRSAHSRRHRRRGRAVVHRGRVRQLAKHQRRRAKVALGWRGASWAKLSLLTSATTSCFDPKEEAHHEAAAPSSGVHPPLQAWQGEASRCREADGQLLGAEGDHAGHESGRLQQPCCSKRTSGARVLSATGLTNYGDMTTSEFQSHLIKLDTTFRGDMRLQSRALLRACWCRAASPTSDDRLCHQQEHRELLVVQPRGPPEAATGLFQGLRASLDERRTLIFYRDSGKGKTPLASCLAAMVARDVGLDEFVMVSSPDMLRSAVERNLLRDERGFRSAAATSAPKAGE